MTARAQEVLDLLGLEVGDEIWVSMGAGFGGNETIVGVNGDYIIVKNDGIFPSKKKGLINVRATYSMSVRGEGG